MDLLDAPTEELIFDREWHSFHAVKSHTHLSVPHGFPFHSSYLHTAITFPGFCTTAEGPFDTLLRLPGSRMLNYQPSMMLALDDSCQLQARLSVETRTSAYQVRTGNFSESPITVYFTIRQFWGRQPYKTYWESYLNQKRILDELVTEHVIPQIITPLQRVIGAKS